MASTHLGRRRRLRTIAGLLAVAAVLAGLGCGGGDSAASGEPNSPKPLAGAQSSPTRKPVVTKKYFEIWPAISITSTGTTRSTLASATTSARVYTDEPEVAYVDRIDAGSVDDDAGQMDGVEVDLTGKVGAVQRQDPVERRNLRKVLPLSRARRLAGDSDPNRRRRDWLQAALTPPALKGIRARPSRPRMPRALHPSASHPVSGYWHWRSPSPDAAEISRTRSTRISSPSLSRHLNRLGTDRTPPTRRAGCDLDEKRPSEQAFSVSRRPDSNRGPPSLRVKCSTS